MLDLSQFRLKPAAQVRSEAAAREARIAELFAPLEARAAAQIAKARADGLIRDPAARTRLSDAAVAR